MLRTGCGHKGNQNKTNKQTNKQVVGSWSKNVKCFGLIGFSLLPVTFVRVTSDTDNNYYCSLLLQDPKPEDGGTYKCTAANDLGESNANITLNFSGALCFLLQDLK